MSLADFTCPVLEPVNNGTGGFKPREALLARSGDAFGPCISHLNSSYVTAPSCPQVRVKSWELGLTPSGDMEMKYKYKVQLAEAPAKPYFVLDVAFNWEASNEHITKIEEFSSSHQGQSEQQLRYYSSFS